MPAQSECHAVDTDLFNDVKVGLHWVNRRIEGHVEVLGWVGHRANKVGLIGSIADLVR
jgi:hypothetical protein